MSFLFIPFMMEPLESVIKDTFLKRAVMQITYHLQWQTTYKDKPKMTALLFPVVVEFSVYWLPEFFFQLESRVLHFNFQRTKITSQIFDFRVWLEAHAKIPNCDVTFFVSMKSSHELQSKTMACLIYVTCFVQICILLTWNDNKL